MKTDKPQAAKKTKKSPARKPSKELAASIFPHPSSPEYRIACGEVADFLAKSWRFKLQVIASVVLLSLVVGATIASYLGWGALNQITVERKRFEGEISKELEEAKKVIERQIAEEFAKENVQKTVEKSAADQADRMLANSIQPTIQKFQTKVDSLDADVEKRFQRFSELLTHNEKSVANDLETLRKELLRVQKRNEITAMADLAVSKGDVKAYREIEDLVEKPGNLDEENAAQSELFRVFQAYSLFSGVERLGGIQLNVKTINPLKDKEEDLSLEELLPLIPKVTDGTARAKIGRLIAPKLKKGSFKTAEILIEALSKETNLEAFKNLGNACRTVVDYKVGDKLDHRGLLIWWKENKERLRKEDTDSPTNAK